MDNSESVDTSASDILERAMEGIGPLDMDYTDAQGDGDKMTIDLSATSENSDQNIDSSPPRSAKSPTKHTPPSSAKKKPSKTGKNSDMDTSESANVPNFGFSPDRSEKPEKQQVSIHFWFNFLFSWITLPAAL